MTITLPPNSTGTTVDTVTISARDREIIVVGDPATAAATAAVSNTSSVGGAAQALAVRNIPIKQQPASPLTTTTLGISGVFTQAGQDSQADASMYVQASARADVASATNGFIIQESDDSAAFTDANFTRTVAQVTVSAATTTFLSANIRGRFWRVQYTNGGTAQTSFKLEATASAQPPLNVGVTGTLLVDGSAVTQPVSGTITANAGSGTFAENVAQFGGTNVATGTGASGAGIPRVTISNDSSLAANQSVNVAQIAGTAIGTAAAGVQKVGVVGNAGAALDVAQNTAAPANVLVAAGRFDTTLPTVASGSAAAIELDASGRITLGTSTATIGALTANQSINVAQVAGTATATAAAGVQKVGVVGNAGAIFDGATAAAVPANAILDGARGATANPTAVTDGQLVAAMADKLGRQVVVPGHVRDLVTDGGASTTISSTTETTILAAAAAGVFHDVTSLIISNTSATGVRVDIRDATGGATIRLSLWAPATQMVGVVFQVPFKQTTAANNWTAQLSAAVTDVRIQIQAVKNF